MGATTKPTTTKPTTTPKPTRAPVTTRYDRELADTIEGEQIRRAKWAKR